MSGRTRETIYDPDLDTPHPMPAVEAEYVAESQRLVANPALAFLVWLVAYMVIRHALIGHHLGLFFLGIFLASVPLPMGQFHCLDCGVTGWAAGRPACLSIGGGSLPRSNRTGDPDSTLANSIHDLGLSGRRRLPVIRHPWPPLISTDPRRDLGGSDTGTDLYKSSGDRNDRQFTPTLGGRGMEGKTPCMTKRSARRMC